MDKVFNILLDPLPQEWNGYPIDSDFQTGIQVYWILEDPELDNHEKLIQAARLLFIDRKPESLNELADAIMWFLHGWETDNPPKDRNSTPVLDFQMDQWRIWVAFKSQFQIDLNRQKLHFWVFMVLLNNLEECSLTRVEEIRGKKLTGKMTAEERKYYARAKEVYAIKKNICQKEYTTEDIDAIDAFDAMRRKAFGK